MKRFLFALLVLLLFARGKTNSVNYTSRDLTWEAGASGRDVVEATIQKIKRFSDVSQDFSILRRYALMESTFGEDKERVHANPGGGIWQINLDVHNLSSVITSSPPLSTLVARMEHVFNIECLYCAANYSTPMVSGLVAQAFNEHIYGPNTPGNVTVQSEAWAEDYHPQGNVTNFTQVVTAFNEEEDMFCDDEFKLDLWILLDDSEDISDEEFESQLNFISALASKFSVSNSKIQIGFSVLSNNEHEIHFWFNESDSLSSLKTAVSDTRRNEVNLQTDEAIIDIVNSRFSSSNGARSPDDVTDLRRVLVIVTDANIPDDIDVINDDMEGTATTTEIATTTTSQGIQSSIVIRVNRQAPEEYAQSALSNVEDSNVSVIVVGVGSTFDMNKLNAMATGPDDEQVFTFSDFSELNATENKNKVYNQICKSTFAESIFSYVESNLAQNPSSYQDPDHLMGSVQDHFQLQCFDCGDQKSDDVKESISNIFDNNKVMTKESGKDLKNKLITWSNEDYDGGCKDDLKMDLWFLMNAQFEEDDSNFNQATNFVSNTVSNFTVSSSNVQVGMSVCHANKHEVYFNLNDHANSSDLFEDIKEVKKPIKTRETGKALHDILHRGFTEEMGVRPLTSFVPRALIIVTNGRDNVNYISPAKELFESNITVFGVGIGDYVNTSELDEMVSPPIRKHSYHLYEFNKLEEYFIPEIYQKLCRSPISVTSSYDITLVLKKGVERYLWAKVLEDKDLRINFATSDTDKVGKAYVSVAVTEPSGAYYDISIDLGKNSTKILVKASELLAKHKGRIQDIEKWIVRNGTISVYMTLLTTGNATMNLTTAVEPLDQGSPIPVNEGDDVIATTAVTTTSTSTLMESSIAYSAETISTVTASTASSTDASASSGVYSVNESPSSSSSATTQNIVDTFATESLLPSPSTNSIVTTENYEGASPSVQGDGGSITPSTDDLNTASTQKPASSKPASTQPPADNDNTSQKGEEDNQNEVTEPATPSISYPDRETSSTGNTTVVAGGKGLPIDAGEGDAVASAQTGNSSSSLGALAVLPLFLIFIFLIFLRKKKKKKVDPAVKMVAMQELKEATEQAQMASATREELKTLKTKLEVVSTMDIPDEELIEAKKTMKSLQIRLDEEEIKIKRIEKIMQDLKVKAIAAQAPTATVASMEELEEELHNAKKFDVSYDETKEFYDVLSRLKSNINRVMEDLETITDETAKGTILPSSALKLEDHISLCATLAIPQDKLKASYQVLELTKKRINSVEKIIEASAEAKELSASEDTLNNLKQQLMVGEELNIPAETLKEPYAVAVGLELKLKEQAEKREKTEKMLQELKTATEHAQKPMATVEDMKLLEEVRQRATEFGISRSQLKESSHALQELKHKIKAVLENLDRYSEDVTSPDATFVSMEKLEKEIERAETLKIPSDQWNDAQVTLEGMNLRVAEFMKELEKRANDVADPLSSSAAMESLQDQLDEGRRLQLPKSQLKEAYSALDKIKARMEVLKDLEEVTMEAKHLEASEYSLHKLQEKLGLGKSLGLTQGQMQHSNKTMKELEERLEKEAERLNQSGQLLEELKVLTSEAKLPTANLPTMQKLEFMLNKAGKLSIAKEELEESRNALNTLKDRVETVTKDLKSLTEEAARPDATTESMEKLAQQLELAESLKIPPRQLKKAYEGLEEIKDKVDSMAKELNTEAGRAKDPNATMVTMETLQDKLNAAEQMKLPKIQLQESQDALEQLKSRMDEVIKDLSDVTNESSGDSATFASIDRLQEQLIRAENLKIPKNQLEGSYRSLEELKERVEKFVGDLGKTTDEANASSATMTCAERLKEQLVQAEKLKVPTEQLEASYNALEQLKERSDKVMKELIATTTGVQDPGATMDSMLRLEESLVLAKNFQISDEKLQESRNALEVLKNRVDKVMRDVGACTEDTRNANATMEDMEKLKTQLELAESLKIPPENLKESYNGLEQMKIRVDTIIKDLNNGAQEAMDPSATMVSLGSLQEKIAMAELFKLPKNELKESQNAVEHLTSRIDIVIKDLNDAALDSKDQSSTFVSMETLQEKLELAENLQIPPEQLKESYNSLEEIKERVNVFIGDLNSTTSAATESMATVDCAERLEEQLLRAENLKIPAEQLKISYNALEKLKGRADQVMRDLADTTNNAMMPTATLLSLGQLEEKIFNAKTLGITEENLKDSCDALEVLRDRVNTISIDLNKATIESNDPGATALSMEMLEEKLLMAKSLELPPEQLKESYDVLEKLRSKMDGVSKHLTALIDETSTSVAIVPCMERLEESLLLAESLHLPAERIRDARTSLEKMRERVDEVKRDLATTSLGAFDDTATVLTMDLLEEKIMLAQSFQLPEEELKESMNALERMKSRVATVTKEIQDFADLTITSEANFASLSALEAKINMAESLHIPTDQLTKAYEAMQNLNKLLEETKSELNIRTDEAKDQMTLTSMLRLEEQILLAEKLEIPQDELEESKRVFASLSDRRDEINVLKESLQIATDNRDLDELTESLERASSMSYLTTWDPEDKELFELLKDGKALEKTLLAETKNSPEEIALRNKLREELMLALKNNIDRKPFCKVLTEFRQSLGSKAIQSDKELVIEAKKVYTVKCKSYLQATLTSAIKQRKSDKLHEALAEVNKALQVGDIRYPDIETTVPLKLAMQKAKDLINVLAEMEKMKQAVMSLKQPTISEIRSYQQPPPVIRNVMEATFLLLGEDRKKVKEWIEIQALVGKMGKDALKRRIVERDTTKITMQDVVKAAPLLAGLRMDEIEEISKASSVFFAWSKCVLHEVEHMHEDD